MKIIFLTSDSSNVVDRVRRGSLVLAFSHPASFFDSSSFFFSFLFKPFSIPSSSLVSILFAGISYSFVNLVPLLNRIALHCSWFSFPGLNSISLEGHQVVDYSLHLLIAPFAFPNSELYPRSYSSLCQSQQYTS